jgi:predicted NBD/HSP70 family sugar kinase
LVEPVALSSRDVNRALILEAVLETGSLTRTEIATSTGVSMPSVSRMVNELLGEGFLVEGVMDERDGVGRRSQHLNPSPDLGCVVGFDLGIYMSRAVISDLSGRILASTEQETPTGASAADLAGWVADQVQSLRSQANPPTAQVLQLVLSLPARVRGGTVLENLSPELGHLAGDEFSARLAGVLPHPFLFETDAVAGLVDQLQDGEARGLADVVLISVSQALTAAVALDGRPRRGRNNAVGAIASLRFGAAVERVGDVATTVGVGRELDRSGRSIDGWSELLNGTEVSTEVRAIRERFVAALTTATAALCAGVDPQLVIFDGRAAPLIAHVLEQLREQLTAALPVVPRLHVITAAGLFSSARGAAVLARQEARRHVLGRLHAARRPSHGKA